MQFIPAKLPGVCRIELDLKTDPRGFLVRTYCEREFRNAGLPVSWVQCNHTMTAEKGAIRGMHFQADPSPEAKLVRCLRGSIFDVLVDVRKDSDTFGQWEGFELSGESSEQLFIPEGFAHGFQCLTGDCHLFYQMAEFYDPDGARGLRWNDPDVGISWPLEVTNLSERDLALPFLNELE